MLGNEHLALRPVGIPEERAEHPAEAAGIAVSCPCDDEPCTDEIDGFGRGRGKADVVDPAAALHWCLPFRLGVVIDREHVEIRNRSDRDICRGFPGTTAAGGPDLGVEHGPVGGAEPLDALRGDRKVVGSAQQRD
ncbi:hypothetical protein [Arthrobacter sp. AQ5-05]|uniref:hypothetical protein n=1 Tax=Arthrobacter sp. AQ5-05 TaxID=2184581 RepID=UPI0015ECB932|nr:hypothetical protein [Arthrobacter sp. AQ5-05]